MMQYNVPLSAEFTKALKRLEDKYGEEMTVLNGLSDSQLGFTTFIDNFIDKQTVADASIDGNANVGHKDVVALQKEMTKPVSKLLSLNKIHYELMKKYGLDTANAWLEGEWNGRFYLHDAYSATFLSYCYAYDLDRLAREGLYFIPDFNGEAPKHLTTFTDFVGEFVSYAANRSSGAVGLPSFLVYSFYFWKRDCEDGYASKDAEYYARQEFQRITYKLNQPYLRVNQSAFTNFSIFDHNYFESLFGGKEFPTELTTADGDKSAFMIDFVEEFIEYQKLFMRVVSEIRSHNMMTFPVLTISLLYRDGKFVDEGFARWANRHNMKWADSNFYISDSVDTLSNCCFDGSQMTLTRSSDGVSLMSFKELYEAKWKDTRRNLTVFHNGSWVKGKVVRLPRRKMYEVITANNKKILVTDNHKNVTLRGDIETTALNTDDYLAFNTVALDSMHCVDRPLSYNQGFLIGMYLGDGCMSGEDKEHITTTVELSLNQNKYDNSLEVLDDAVHAIDKNVDVKLNKQYNNVYPVTIRSQAVAQFIRRFVNGRYSFEKVLNMNSLLYSKEFRQGILDGYYLTDGGNSNRIYTTSPMLAENIECLATSLGLCTTIDVSDRTDEPCIIRGKAFNHNYPVYCVRWYERMNRRTRKDVYIMHNNTMYFKVKSIRQVDTSDECCYCFEMNNASEPYFTLPNGIITHNCRLVSNITNLGYFNSIGGTALEVGSVKVSTVNLARIAYEVTDTSDYLDRLREVCILDLKVLDRVRGIITRNIEKGLLPNYTYGLMHMKNQYNTIGINGLFEALDHFGMIKRDEFGYASYTEDGLKFAQELLATINATKDEFASDKDYMINVEQVPAERCAAILMEKDKLLFPDERYELPLYGNQWIPLGIKCTMNEKIRLSSIMDKACNGGSIAHINIDKPMSDEDEAWELLNHIAEEGVTYFAFCTRISACKHNHGFYGDVCPECGEPKVTTYQRVVGFITPEKNYSKERKAEFKKRTWFDLDNMSELG